MPTAPSDDVSGLLRRWSGGDQRALDQLIPIVYDSTRVLSGVELLRSYGQHYKYDLSAGFEVDVRAYEAARGAATAPAAFDEFVKSL